MYRIDRQKVFWRSVEGETILLNIDSGLYYTISGVAEAIWQSIANGAREEEVVDRIVARYDVEPRRARKDVQALVDSFRKEKLIERTGSDGKR